MGQFATFFYGFWFFMVACNIPTSTAARKKFSCASGTVHLKDHSLNSIRCQVKTLGWIFFNSPTKVTDQKLSYFHLPSFAVTSQTLHAFIFPSIGYFHFVVLVFSYSLKVHFMPNLTTCFDFLWYLPFFYHKPYKVACIFWVFILLEIGSSNSYET